MAAPTPLVTELSSFTADTGVVGRVDAGPPGAGGGWKVEDGPAVAR